MAWSVKLASDKEGGDRILSMSEDNSLSGARDSVLPASLLLRPPDHCKLVAGRG